MPSSRRTDLVLLLTLYVVPVGVAAALLVRANLAVLAVALVAVEAVVAASVWAAKRPPAR